MMDKTISLQSAVELIKNYCENGCDLAEDNWCPSCQREQFIELLKALPSAQPERKTGRWIPTASGKGRHECSRCHEYAPCYQDGSEHLSTFCVLCGAKMERGEEE